VKKDFASLVLSVVVLVFGCAVEELAPKAFGVGVPALLSLAACHAVRRTPLAGLIFAVAAGGAEDALSSLPFATSAGFFVALAALMRGFKLPLAVATPAYCAYQLWLWIWLGARLDGSVHMRMLVSLPVGALTLLAAHFAMKWLDGKAAMDED